MELWSRETGVRNQDLVAVGPFARSPYFAEFLPRFKNRWWAGVGFDQRLPNAVPGDASASLTILPKPWWPSMTGKLIHTNPQPKACSAMRCAVSPGACGSATDARRRNPKKFRIVCVKIPNERRCVRLRSSCKGRKPLRSCSRRWLSMGGEVALPASARPVAANGDRPVGQVGLAGS